MAGRRHSSRGATTQRHLTNASVAIRLQDPRGLGQSSITALEMNRKQRVKEIIEQHLAQMKGGWVQRGVESLAKDYDEAREDLRMAEPAIASLEVEQVKKRLLQCSSSSLGTLESDKPEGYHRFMTTQLNGCTTKLI